MDNITITNPELDILIYLAGTSLPFSCLKADIIANIANKDEICFHGTPENVEHREKSENRNLNRDSLSVPCEANRMKQEKERAEKQQRDRERGCKYCNETLHYEHL